MDLNPLEAYRHAGRMAGRAARNGDMDTTQHWACHFRRMLAAEPDQSRRGEREIAYRDAYRAAAAPTGAAMLAVGPL